MKKSLLILLLICFMLINIAGTRIHVKAFQESEPGCACVQPEFIVELGGKFKLDYKELSICTTDDGSVVLVDRNNENYYIAKGGIMQGPLTSEDPKIAGYVNCYLEGDDMDDMLVRYKDILSKSGEKYLIKMGGKSYGPFIEFSEFTITRSKDKFAVIATTKDAEMPKLVTNIPNATFDIVNTMNAGLCGSMKYDEILVVTYNAVLNLQGRKLFDIKPEMTNCASLFINTSNTMYAFYDFGALTFSNGKSLPDCFNPHFVKSGGTVYLAYMYYSPKRKAIMQCKVPF